MSRIFLCHKCAGHLTAEVGPSAYACSCISGYVRDGQRPVPAADVRNLQVRECLDRLALYEQQGRATTDQAVTLQWDRLKRLKPAQ